VRIAVTGTTTAPSTERSSSRTLTNWFGNRLFAALAKRAFALTVPVWTSI